MDIQTYIKRQDESHYPDKRAASILSVEPYSSGLKKETGDPYYHAFVKDEDGDEVDITMITFAPEEIGITYEVDVVTSNPMGAMPYLKKK